MSVDATVTKLIDEVNRRKAEISKVNKPSWKTNCSFSYDESNKNVSVNLQVVVDKQTLVYIATFLLVRQDYFDKAAKLVEAEGVKCTWQGFSIQDWLDDIKTRLLKLQINSKQKKLDELEERLSKLISPELRAKLELEAITKELAD